MVLLGSHLSIAGGCHNALLRAKALGCETVQIFTKQPSQWAAKPLEEEAIRLFRQTLLDTNLRYPMAHDSYLINLASPKAELGAKSLEAFLIEVERAEQLGLSYLVMHPGAHLEDTEEAGLQRVAKVLDEVHDRFPDYRSKILLETTAGQGTTLGHRFEHLATILHLVQQPQRLGVCFDTCHVFAAGYELSPESEYHKTMDHFDRVIGLNRLLAFHVNDSLKPLGSRRDRHAHIGQGEMGLEPFRLLMNDQRFRDRPMILETAKEEVDGKDMDEVNISTLRGLIKE